MFTYRGVRFTTVVKSVDGFQDSPFKDGTKTNSDVFLKNVDNGKTLAFSPLVPLMMERYGFYEGHGTSYRVDPKDIVDVLTFLSVEKNGEQDSAGQSTTASESEPGGKENHKIASEQWFARGAHLLHTTFDEKDPHWNFNHDVKVRAKGEQLTLIVLYDLNKQDQEADKPDSKPVQGGFGNLSKNDTAKSSEPLSEQEPLVSAKGNLHGSIYSEGNTQFGVTTIRDGKLVSLHFVGRLSLGGASGKVYLLSSKEPVREGAWYLKNSFSRGGSVPGYNGANPIGR